MQTLSLGQVIYTVDDMDRCVDFYRDVVGLHLTLRDGDRWSAFRMGDVTFALAKDEMEVGAGGPGGTAAFRVTDIGAFARDLERRDPALQPAVEIGAHELKLTLRDPSRNAVIFYQPLPRRAA